MKSHQLTFHVHAQIIKDIHSDGSLFFFAKAVPDVSSVPLEKPTGAQLGVGRLLVFSDLVKNGRERIYNFGSRMSRDGFVRIKRLVK